jgi:hypothetical protein
MRRQGDVLRGEQGQGTGEGGEEASSQCWDLPCPVCRRPLALDLTVDEVAQLAQHREEIVRAHRPAVEADVVTVTRWNAQHARGCRYRVASTQEEPQSG